MTEPGAATPADPIEELARRLTPEEDDELRSLHWISKIGALSVRKRERMLELRVRDRRQEVRPLREFDRGDPRPAEGTRRRWFRRRSR